MTCPVCGEQTIIYNSRKPDCETVIRWRRCKACDYRFKTEERELNDAVKRYTKKEAKA